MALTLWFVRGSNEDFDFSEIYGEKPNIFSLKVHHGGRFSSLSGRKYVFGKINFIDMVDADQFSLTELDAMVQELGYSKDEVIYYQFRIPNRDLDCGLIALECDADVLKLLQYVEKNKTIDIYTSHLETMLHTGTSQPIKTSQLSLEWPQHDDSEDTDDEDSDFIVDEANIVEDVQVDMDEFRALIDKEVDVEDEDIDDLLEHEVDLDDFDSLSDEENDPPLKRALKKLKKTKKQQKKDDVVVPFYVGQDFSSREEIKNLVKRHAIDSRRQLCIVRNDKLRFRVVCFGKTPVFENAGESQKASGSNSVLNEPQKGHPKPTCPWILHISNRLKVDTLIVKTFKEEHNCLHTREVRLCTISFLAREVQSILESNPTIPLRALQDQLQKKLQIQVSTHKIFRAKAIAIQKIQGDYKVQYALLRDYCDELIRLNPGTTIKIDVEREANPSSSSRQFRRIYICLGAMKEGFKLSGRDILGLDGCFIKGPYPGQVLTAVGLDSNNGIYPFAYAIVEAESSASWTWFLECLGDDLGLFSNSNFTFISNRQKGIIPAILKVFPSAEHRYCLRHIHENMKQRWRGQLFKNMLWKCASATTIPEFDRAMENVKIQDQSLYDWLKQIDPKQWSRAHFDGRAKSDVLLNNLCEVFNKQLIEARDKPIITCLEYIREYMMRRILIVHRLISKCDGPLTPNATKAFTAIKADASQYTVLWNANNKYQVSGPWMDQCVVDVGQKTCSCRKWELSGMPCKHAVAVNWNMASHGVEVGVAESWVSEVYWLETWKKVYQQTVDPINGRNLWTPSSCPTTLIPPKHHKQIGRPKKKKEEGS